MTNRKKSTYVRLLKPGQTFMGTGSFPSIYTVFKLADCRCTDQIKVVTTTGKQLYYPNDARVQLL